MSDVRYPMPIWYERVPSPELRRQIGRLATKIYIRAAVHISGESSSALSKRLASDTSIPGSNSKYLCQLGQGKHTLLPKLGNSKEYDWFAAVARRCRGGIRDENGRGVTAFYYAPWELMVQNAPLDRVRELLYQALQFSFYGGIEDFFCVPIPRLPDSKGWLRKDSHLSAEAAVLWDESHRWVATKCDREWQVFDRLSALWCLYREAVLRRDLVRSLYYREVIIESHREVGRHPVMSQIFGEYRELAMRVLESDGLPTRDGIDRSRVGRLGGSSDSVFELEKWLTVSCNYNSLAHQLFLRGRVVARQPTRWRPVKVGVVVKQRNSK